MRLITITLALLLALAISAQQKPYTVTGNIGKYNAPAKAYLFYWDKESNSLHSDSCALQNGFFAFSGKLAYTVPAYISLDPEGKGQSTNSPHRLQFYLDPGTTTRIKGDIPIDRATITGSPTTSLSLEYAAKLATFQQEGELLQKTFEEATPEQRQSKQFTDSLNHWRHDIQRRYNDMTLNFIAAHPNSMLGVFMLLSEISVRPGNEAIEATYLRLSDSIRNSVPGQTLAHYIEENRTIPVGNTAPDFASTTPDRQTVKLSDLRGKYVLLSFWSPDCDNCRREIPLIAQVYRQYKDKPFTILSVGILPAEERQLWTDVIAQERMEWTNVSDLKEWQSDIVKLYNVYLVPFNYLIDPQGKVVAKELYGAALSQKLKSIFGE